ncbi:MAG TPA: hypothetical protein PK876_05400 [Elusimicrobiota bacterium]|nr:hypothetical protein [Elusimicrobiota bacterium]
MIMEPREISHKKHHFLLLVGLISFVTVFKLLIVTKLAYFSEAEGMNFVQSNLLWDDGAGYVLSMTTFNDPIIAKQDWVKPIHDHIRKKDLVDKWGKWGIKFLPHLKPISPNSYPLYNMLAKGYRHFCGDFSKAFLWMLLTYPIWVLVKNILLLMFFIKTGDKTDYVPLLYSIFFLDLVIPYSHIYYWFTSEAYAQLPLSIGLTLWLFKRDMRWNRLISYSFVFLSALISLTSAFIFLALLLSDLVRSFPQSLVTRYLTFVKTHFNAILFSLLAATIPLAFLYFSLDLIHAPKRYDMYLDHFRTSLSYITLFNLLLVVFLRWLCSDMDVRESATLLLPVLILYLFAFMIVCVAPFTDDQWRCGVGRLNGPIYSVLIMAIGYALLSRKSLMPTSVYSSCLRGITIAGIVIMLPLYTGNEILKIKRAQPFTEADYAEKKVEDGFVYYLARNPQHIYNYINDGWYQKAPLVLDIETDNYSPSKIARYLKKRSNNAESNP